MLKAQTYSSLKILQKFLQNSNHAVETWLIKQALKLELSLHEVALAKATFIIRFMQLKWKKFSKFNVTEWPKKGQQQSPARDTKFQLSANFYRHKSKAFKCNTNKSWIRFNYKCRFVIILPARSMVSFIFLLLFCYLNLAPSSHKCEMFLFQTVIYDVTFVKSLILLGHYQCRGWRRLNDKTPA